MGEFGEGGEEGLDAFGGGNSACEEEVGAGRGGRGWGNRKWGAWRAGVEGGEEGKDPDGGFESGEAVAGGGVGAGGEEGVYVLNAFVAKVGVAPPLGGNAGFDGAADAVASVAGALVVFPEDVGGAQEPVLVQGVELDGGAAHSEDGGAANEGDVVEVDDVEVSI